MSGEISVRPLDHSDVSICEEILRSLPEWFGIEEAIVQYVRDCEAMETWVAWTQGRIAGFLTLNHHNPFSSEIQVMAVRPDLHRQGVGRALVHHAEERVRGGATRFLQVKTLGPSRPNEHYARTRAFYERLGFTPLEENHLWGPVNPCLIMVKHIGAAD